MTTYRFRDLRQPRTVDELTPLDEERLVICGKRYDGRDLSLEERLAFDEDDDDEAWPGIRDPYLEIWAIDADGKHAYDLWHYRVDSGTIFHADGTEVFGDVIQFGFGGPGGSSNAVADELQRAYREVERAAAEARKNERAAAKAAAEAEKPAGAKKRPSAKKPAATKKKPAAKAVAAKKPAGKKPGAKKPAARKPAARKTVAKKTMAKKRSALTKKRPVAKKKVLGAKKPAPKQGRGSAS